jgi:esterase/lipase superfamily enzyme
MKTEYHNWYSRSLEQEMALKSYGYFGKPVLVFPAQGGRFFDFENFGMIDAVESFIETGRIKMFCVDSIDNQSWANWNVHPADRALRHEQYDQYITQEVVPFIREQCGDFQGGMMTTGASMGAYHAANFFFRHPDIFNAVIAISGVYQLKMFVGDYMDEIVYLNSPINFLPKLDDSWYLDRYRESEIIFCCGQGAWEDEMISDSQTIKQILDAKRIPNWVDFWGYDVNHDWPWWQKMLPYFLDYFSYPPYSG